MELGLNAKELKQGYNGRYTGVPVALSPFLSTGDYGIPNEELDKVHCRHYETHPWKTIKP
jgi:hypothetical protein